MITTLDTVRGLRRARVVEVLQRAKRPMHRTRIAEGVGLSRGQTNRAIKALAGNGTIRSRGRGVWEVAS